MKYFIPLFILAVCLSSCAPKDKDQKNEEKIALQRISSDGYSLGIPTYMTKTTSLNEEASLQFQNIFKETYVIVIDESKKEFINAYKELSTYDTTVSVIANYSNVQIQSITAKLNDISKKNIKTLKINGSNAAMIELVGTIEGVKFPIAYFLTFIEGDNKLYMIMAWTLVA